MSIDDSEAGFGTKSTRKPTVKQSRFAAAYADPSAANGNGTLAANMAGYKGNANQLGVQAFANLRNPKVQQLISSIVDSMTERALQRLGEALDATSSRVFLDKSGNVVYAKPVPDHRIRLDAVDFLFDLRGKCAAIAPDKAHELDQAGDVVGAEQMNPADRALLEEADVIEAELGKLDCGLSDRGADDSDDDHDRNE
jgi:hypothetical protein